MKVYLKIECKKKKSKHKLRLKEYRIVLKLIFDLTFANENKSFKF